MSLHHHSLVAWQRADDLFITLHQLALQAFPPHEKFELGSQLRRAAYSVPANIVEGFARRYRRARVHFLNIAEGSLAEVGYCLHAARRLGYITDAKYDELEIEVKKVSAPPARQETESGRVSSAERGGGRIGTRPLRPGL